MKFLLYLLLQVANARDFVLSFAFVFTKFDILY
jgi:hypothetical protein